MTKKFEPTQKQLEKWNALTVPTMPTDDEFKASWKRSHHGKEAGWGMGKRDWIASHSNDHMTCTPEYYLGLWQGRVDALNGVTRADTPDYHTNPSQFGYYSGYEGFSDFWKGYDQNAKKEFSEKYLD